MKPRSSWSPVCESCYSRRDHLPFQSNALSRQTTRVTVLTNSNGENANGTATITWRLCDKRLVECLISNFNYFRVIPAKIWVMNEFGQRCCQVSHVLDLLSTLVFILLLEWDHFPGSQLPQSEWVEWRSKCTCAQEGLTLWQKCSGDELWSLSGLHLLKIITLEIQTVFNNFSKKLWRLVQFLQ